MCKMRLYDSIVNYFNELARAYRPNIQTIIWFVDIDTNFKLPKLHLKVHEEQMPISVRFIQSYHGCQHTIVIYLTYLSAMCNLWDT